MKASIEHSAPTNHTAGRMRVVGVPAALTDHLGTALEGPTARHRAVVAADERNQQAAQTHTQSTRSPYNAAPPPAPRRCLD